MKQFSAWADGIAQSVPAAQREMYVKLNVADTGKGGYIKVTSEAGRWSCLFGVFAQAMDCSQKIHI